MSIKEAESSIAVLEAELAKRYEKYRVMGANYEEL